MGKAGQFALNAAARQGTVSYSTAATVGERWQQFTAFAREQGVRQMEYVSQALVQTYGQQLATRVDQGVLSASYAQNLVSAINSVMVHATHSAWKSVSPTKTCGIAERSGVRNTPPTGLERGQFATALQSVRDAGFERGAAIAELARELGLRSKEGALLDASRALREAQTRGTVTIQEGTKGGRSREVPITHERQLQTLAQAAQIQADHSSLVPTAQTWAQFREGELRDTRELLQVHGIERLHDLRAAYACERYTALTGHAAPVQGGQADRQSDRAAREHIAHELGHNRTDVTNSYLGGQS